MQFHTELNPKLWNKNNEEYTLKEEVKAKLEEIASAFIEYLEIPQDSILDKVITGSSASYNYTEFSDLDLHIIVDFDKVHKDCPVVEGYLNSMKSTFNKEHDIFIHGVPVELYAEKKDQGTVHNGLYSLETGWIDIPKKIEPTDNDAAVEAKYNELKELIDKCETAEVADELLDKIYTMRKSGLADAGEFSTENLAFKKLRNEGVMNKLRQLKKQEVDKQLSLESYNEEVTVDSYLKMLRDGGHLSDKEDAQYLIQCFNNKKLEILAEYKDVEKAAQRFLDCCNKYDKVVFKQLFDNGKEIKVIDTDTKELNKKPLFLQNEDYEWHGPVAKITFDNGEVITTCINGTDKEIKAYYMGKTFNLGTEKDDMHKVVNVEVIRESEDATDLIGNFKSMAKRIVRDFKIEGYPKSNRFYMDFAKEAIAQFEKDWGKKVKLNTGNGELILTFENVYQATINAQTHKIKFSDLENSNSMFETKGENKMEQTLNESKKVLVDTDYGVSATLLINEPGEEHKFVIVDQDDNAFCWGNDEQVVLDQYIDYMISHEEETDAIADIMSREENVKDERVKEAFEKFLNEQLDEDCATLEKKMDSVQDDLNAMIRDLSYISDDQILESLKKSIKEALE